MNWIGGHPQTDDSRHGVYVDFSHEPPNYWRRYLAGNGSLEQGDTTLQLVTAATSTREYSDAQLDDYRVVAGRPFLWQPPLRLLVRARFSHPEGALVGTAGFGFWNYPFLFPEGRLPTLPRASWFFYASPPSDMKLDTDTPGAGWKAATIDLRRPAAWGMAPLAPLIIPAMHSRRLYRGLWPRIQRNLSIQEALVGAEMTDWHVYALEWGVERAHFLVDGRPVLPDAPAPGGPMCFVLWLDNQYLVVAPWGAFRWGLLNGPHRQFLEVDWLAITPLAPAPSPEPLSGSG